MLRALTSCLALLLLVNCGSPQQAAQSARNEIQALLNAQMKAWNSGDIEGFMDGYENSKKLVFTSGATIRRGWQETLEKYKGRYGDKPETMGNLTFKIDETRFVGPNAAVVLGYWALKGGEADGANGVFSLVLTKTSGRWRIVHDHTVADAPAEENAEGNE